MQRIPCPEQACAEPTEDIHHLVWPRSEYKTPVEKQYRNLGCHVVRICRCLHNEIHATQKPPEKPSRDLMLGMIERAGG